MFENQIDTSNQIVNLKDFQIENYSLCIKREDEIHPFVSGNKFRKLKYNISEALSTNQNQILTFGGAFSNHIAAVAFVGKSCGIKTIGIIRGEELKNTFEKNPTLSFAKENGMELHFVSREAYRTKEEVTFLEKLKERLGNFYLIPEGGSNTLAVKGCEEILTKEDFNFDYICVSVGTGGTIAGIIKASNLNQKVIGFSALKGTFQESEIKKFTSKSNYLLTDDYSFGGYAKLDSELVRFVNEFKKNTNILLDPVYTGKMMFGIVDLINKGFFRKNSRILAIHTGGLQGIAGMNLLLKKRNLPQINN